MRDKGKLLKRIYRAYNHPMQEELAKKLIMAEYARLCCLNGGQVLKDVKNLSLDKCISFLAKEYRCNIIIFGNENKKTHLIHMSGKINYQKPRLYLYQSLMKNKITHDITGHLKPIRLVKSFRRRYGESMTDYRKIANISRSY